MNFSYNLSKSLHCALRKSVRSFWSVRSVFVLRRRNFHDTSVNTKPIVFRPIGVRCILDKKIFVSTSPIVRTYEKSVFDVDTNVKKDVLLYENKTTSFYILNILIPAQLLVWLGLTYQYFEAVQYLPPEFLNVFNLIDLNNPRWRYAIPFAFTGTGLTIFLSAFAYARKNVWKIILHKGGKSVYIETFGLFGLGKKNVVNLDNLNCTVSRISSRGYVPLKRKGTGFLADYLVDNTGHYPDPFLFDMTAGLQRTFKEEKK